MKKILKTIIVLLLAIIIINSETLNASAMVVESGKKYWTLEELKEVMVEMEDKAIETCGEDFSCRKNVYENFKKSSDKVYQAANLVSGKKIIISSINPSTSTIKVIYQGRDSLGLRNNTKNWQLTSTELYLMWAEPEMKSVFDADMQIMKQYMIAEEEADGIHFIYQANSEKNLLPEVDKEMTIVMNENNLAENSLGIINYYERGDDGSNIWGSLGSVKYSQCLSRAGYEPGMDCLTMFTDSGAYSFFPAVTLAPKEDDASESDKNEDNEEKGEESGESSEEQEKNADGENDEEDGETGEVNDEAEDEIEDTAEGEVNDEAEDEIEDTAEGEIKDEAEDEVVVELEPAPEEKIEDDANADINVDNKGVDSVKGILAPETGYQNEGATIMGGGYITLFLAILIINYKKVLKRY